MRTNWKLLPSVYWQKKFAFWSHLDLLLFSRDFEKKRRLLIDRSEIVDHCRNLANESNCICFNFTNADFLSRHICLDKSFQEKSSHVNPSYTLEDFYRSIWLTKQRRGIFIVGKLHKKPINILSIHLHTECHICSSSMLLSCSFDLPLISTLFIHQTSRYRSPADHTSIFNVHSNEAQ